MASYYTTNIVTNAEWFYTDGKTDWFNTTGTTISYMNYTMNSPYIAPQGSEYNAEDQDIDGEDEGME